MKIVVQRVTRANVTINGTIVGSIDNGMLVLVGVHRDDTEKDADFLADKCADLRIFSDNEGKMNRSLVDVAGGALVVSQFTLLGDCSKGRRPSFIEAAQPEKGEHLYLRFIEKLREKIPRVETGLFGATMQVELVNNGPVTMILNSTVELRRSA